MEGKTKLASLWWVNFLLNNADASHLTHPSEWTWADRNNRISRLIRDGVGIVYDGSYIGSVVLRFETELDNLSSVNKGNSNSHWSRVKFEVVRRSTIVERIVGSCDCLAESRSVNDLSNKRACSIGEEAVEETDA